MKIITYNVNGLRAAVSKGLPEWLVQENPDILCLQETKLQPDQYPAEVFEAGERDKVLDNDTIAIYDNMWTELKQ